MDRRKTQESVKDKATSRPSTRISRLVQPRKYSATPGSLIRNRSASSENVSSYNRQLNKRARSATPHIPSETPIRPIVRSLSSLFTPASTSKNATAKKAANNELVTRIVGVLRKHFGPTYLPGGLQSTSAKQFVEIIRFFAQQICGNKITIQDNNVDDIKRFVDFVEYPHQMNKSWFKAPTVSIAYDRNVEFLDWLCDFIVDDDCTAPNDDNFEYKVSDSGDLVDQRFAASFVGDLRNSFVIWSERNADFDEWKSEWIQKMITEKTGLNDIDASIKRVDNEYKELQTKDSPFGNEHLLQSQQQKIDTLKAEVKKARATVAGQDVEYQVTTGELKNAILKNAELTSKVNEMKATIENQTVSADDRQSLAAELEQKKDLLEQKQKFVESMKEIEYNKELQIARIKKQKRSKVFSLNAFTQQLFQIGVDFGEITVDHVTIHESDTKDEIQSKMGWINRIKEIAGERLHTIRASLHAAQSELTSISNELFVLEDEMGAHKKRLHSGEIRMQKIDNEIVDTKYNAEQRQQQLQVKIDNETDRYEQIDLKIKNSERATAAMKEENEKIFQGIKKRSDALHDAKRERQARQEEALAELKQVAEQLKEAAAKNAK